MAWGSERLFCFVLCVHEGTTCGYTPLSVGAQALNLNLSNAGGVLHAEFSDAPGMRPRLHICMPSSRALQCLLAGNCPNRETISTHVALAGLMLSCLVMMKAAGAIVPLSVVLL